MAKEPNKFVAEEGEMTMTLPEDGELYAIEAELAKVNAVLEAAGVSEGEQEALAAEPYGKEEK